MILTRVVNAIIGIIETIFLVYLALQLFGANSSSPFVAWLYGVATGLATPFLGTFPVVSLGGNSTFNFSIVLAMIVYAVIGWLVIQILSFVFNSRTI